MMDRKPEGADEFPRGDGGESQPGPPPIVITRPTWVTWAAFFASIGIFIGVNLQKSQSSWAVLSGFGYFPAEVIWDGTWWGTLSSTFVHINFVHAFFNLYWLWLLGRLMESEIGSVRFLLFYLGAAIVSSTAQLAVADVTGHGASGVLYAVFGFMWRTRAVYPNFQSIMVPQTIKVFFIWLVACFFLTATKMLNIANAAHVGGLIFGVVVADCFVIRRPRILYAMGAIILGALSLVPLWWAPWSTTWQAVKAQNALKEGRTEEAMQRLNIIIERDPEDAWAYRNRGRLYLQMGEKAKAVADAERAQELGNRPPEREEE